MGESWARMNPGSGTSLRTFLVSYWFGGDQALADCTPHIHSMPTHSVPGFFCAMLRPISGHRCQAPPTFRGFGNKSTMAIRILLSVSSSLFLAHHAIAANGPPNFVFVLADYMSWVGSSVQMDPNIPGSRSDYHQTPNMESLASQGMVFSNANAAAPMCSPSRAAIISGKSPSKCALPTSVMVEV